MYRLPSDLFFSTLSRATWGFNSRVFAPSQFLHLSPEPTSHLLFIFLHLSHASGLVKTMVVEIYRMTYLWFLA